MLAPAAGHARQDIPDGYAAPAAAAEARTVVGALIATLMAHAMYELAAFRQR